MTTPHLLLHLVHSLYSRTIIAQNLLREQIFYLDFVHKNTLCFSGSRMRST